ncbi:MAG: dienelactone hydrolase family protein [Nitrosopumilaceae archaeon]
MNLYILFLFFVGAFSLFGIAHSEQINVMEWDIPTPDSSPHDVVVGNDGMIWFTEISANKIGKFDPVTETFTEYKTSSESSGPYAIWVDPFDNVWFSMTGIYKMGKFDQSTQTLHEYDMPSPQTHIKFIHTDTDGNVWFPNYNNNKIGVIYASNTNENQKPTEMDAEQKISNLSPLKQFDNGVNPIDVVCSEDLELVLKSSNGMPACVNPESISKLIEWGWAIHVLPDYEKNENNNSEIFTLGEFSVDTMNVSYYQNAKGYLAKPVTDGDYPAVIMIHEWWGLNENIRDMAEKLASHGYVVFAVDLYDGNVATTADEARQLRSSFDEQYWIENMNTATVYVEENYSPEKIGSIGWCFGGGQSLNLAINNDEMDATVIYYGSLVTDQESLSSINWPILGIFAELDQGIPPEQVNVFEDTLNILEIPNDIYIYPDVNHAFANPSGDRYAPEATMDAWQKTIEFFAVNLK